MSIQVTCECGFHKEVPDQWKGMRVTCKCGRSFVICDEGGIQEPPVAAPPSTISPQAAPTDASVHPQAGHPPQRNDSVAARYRARHRPADARKRFLLLITAALTMACLVALALVLPGGLETRQSTSKGVEKDSTPTPPTSSDPAKVPRDPQAAAGNARRGGAENPAAGKPTFPGAGTAAGLEPTNADVVALEPDDGLLLTGLFGDEYQQLELSEEQTPKVDELAGQFETVVKSLADGELELKQWYMEGERIGRDLLDQLTDVQRDRLLDMLQQQHIDRVRLEEFAARLRPEFATPSVAWRIEADGTEWPTIEDITLSLPTSGQCVRTVAVTGLVAHASAATSPPVKSTRGAERKTFEIWDVAGGEKLGRCTLPHAASTDITLLARDGRSIVRGGPDERGDYRVQLWTIDSSSEPQIRTIRGTSGGGARGGYRLVDCVNRRVVCVSDRGFWVWNLDADRTRHASFADWVPAGMPACAVSAGGRYIAMAHQHDPVIDSKQYHFVEVGLYDVDTGELLGNQVLAADYRPMRVTALAFSYNGRELALLWDVASPEPTRLLMQISAVDGRLIHQARQLPTAQESFARTQGISQRDLIWLPDHSGWIINLRSLADTESDAVIDIPYTDAEHPAMPNIVEGIPASGHRLLILTVEEESPDEPAENVPNMLRGRTLDLPELGPFM